MKGERLSNRQIATLKQLAICCSAGGQFSLTKDQREAIAEWTSESPTWRRT